MATSTQARQTVMLSIGGTAAMAAVHTIRDGSMPSPRILVGAIVAAIALTALAGPAPDIAAGIALISAIATAIIVGPDTFRFPTKD